MAAGDGGGRGDGMWIDYRKGTPECGECGFSEQVMTWTLL